MRRQRLRQSDIVPLARVKRGQVFMKVEDCWGAPRGVLVASSVAALRSKMERLGSANLTPSDDEQAGRKTASGITYFSIEEQFCPHCGEAL